MEDFIRALFESEISEAQCGHSNPPEQRIWSAQQNEIYEILKKNLSPEDFALFEKYIALSDLVNTEEQFYTFCCGIRIVSRVLIGTFFLGC